LSDHNKHSWDGKRYHSLSYHLKQKFGQKVFKIPLDAGFTCPNRDGTLSRDGCYYCSARGSGDFAGTRTLSIGNQFEQLKSIMHRKWKKGVYIAYFQAFTNTYAPVDHLRSVYEQALQQPGVVGLAVSTRPDCLPPEVLDLLAEINQRTYLWVELGLQTIHARTSRLVNLQYEFADFSQSLVELQARSIDTVAHLILGLPGEGDQDMMASAQVVTDMPIQGLKIHLLHVMQETPLAQMYYRGNVNLLSQEHYVKLVADIIEHTPADIVIHRLTGDSPRDILIGPRWSLNKWEVLNNIDNELLARNTWQGKKAGSQRVTNIMRS